MDAVMEFLIDPNVSYFLLILGFLTAVLALFAPGTGLLEIGALLTLTLAAYGIINLPYNWWALVIMGAGIIPFAAALFIKGRGRAILITAAALAFVIGSALLFRGEGWLPAVHPVLILLLSTVALGLTYFMASKTLESAKARPVFDLDRLVGMTGEASSDIRGQGTVYVNGEEWTATSAAFIPEGSRVRVIKRSGLSLEVEPETK
jgi:membrane-bound serine protease (ClpP class)